MGLMLNNNIKNISVNVRLFPKKTNDKTFQEI